MAQTPAGGPRMASDGKALVTVVVPASAGPVTKLAADDLRRCLGKALGVDVPSAGQLSDVETPVSILVGDSFGVDFEIGLDGLQRDGCILKTRGNALLITGVADEGIANGVYTFLADCVGAEWYAPGDIYEVVPSRPDLELPSLDVKRNPDLGYRIFSGCVGELGKTWERRNRIDTTIGNLPYYGFGHNLGSIISAKAMGKDHPEYFAMIDGKRQTERDGPGEGAQPCFTNTDVIRIAAEAADTFFRKNPERTTFSLCVNDNSWFCRCPNCAALDEPMRKSKSGWDIHSDSYFHFVSEVAKIVAKTNPGRYLGCYAYWGVELPPRQIERLPDNVVIALTQDTSQHFDPDYKKADRELWLAWSKAAKHLGKYDYYGLGWLTPRFFPHLAAEDIAFIRGNAAAGFYCEVYPNWSVTAPQLYMTTRLLWDSSLNADIVLDDYYTSLFGRAAPEMKKFYSMLEQYWTRGRKGQWFQGLDNIQPELDMADETLIEQAWQCLFRAKPMVVGREVEHIADIEDHFKFSYLVVKGFTSSRRAAKWEITGQEDLAKLVGEMLITLENVRSAEKCHKEVWLADPLYRQTYYEGERFERKFKPWHDVIRVNLQAAVKSISAYCRTEMPSEQGDTVWNDLRDRLMSDPTAKGWNLAGS